MNTPTESPPDKPVVHSFEIDSLEWWKRSGIWIVGILGMGVVFGIISSPGRGCRKKPNQTEAVNNARQIGFALDEFQETYGSFPDAKTIGPVRQKTGTDLNLGTNSSNDFFRQLFAAGAVESKWMFYARIQGTHKPDNVFKGTQMLEKGECGFTYLMGAFNGCNPNRPLAVTPMIPGTDRFDPKPFEGKAVMLMADKSVRSFTIDKEGHAILDRNNFMDPAHPVWQGKPPSIAWPDL